MNVPAVEDCLGLYKRNNVALSGFMSNVVSFFGDGNDDLLDDRNRSVIHSVRWRLKDPEHLRNKLARKIGSGREITKDNFFAEITDLCGVRVLHLRQTHCEIIHSAIKSHIDAGHWCLAEAPKAYTWDPEYKTYFEQLGLGTEIKESFYTSVHYLVRPNATSHICCEIQVRSLFEEVWGEVDHDLNYPEPSGSGSCREQLKVLAKLVGAGTKLVESIYSSLDRE